MYHIMFILQAHGQLSHQSLTLSHLFHHVSSTSLLARGPKISKRDK